MQLQIKRASREAEPFVAVNNQTVRDDTLSFEARGLLIYLLSHKDGWALNYDMLKQQGLSEKRARVLIRQLEDAGYIERIQQQSQDGRFLPLVLQIREQSEAVKNVASDDTLAEKSTVNHRLPKNGEAVNRQAANRLAVNDRYKKDQDKNHQDKKDQSENQINQEDERDDFPEYLIGFEFEGICPTPLIEMYVQRLGRERVVGMISKCQLAGGKTWHYVIAALKNECESKISISPFMPRKSPLIGNPSIGGDTGAFSADKTPLERLPDQNVSDISPNSVIDADSAVKWAMLKDQLRLQIGENNFYTVSSMQLIRIDDQNQAVIWVRNVHLKQHLMRIEKLMARLLEDCMGIAGFAVLCDDTQPPDADIPLGSS